MNNLSIVMYHYVRPIAGSEFPGIKGLELEGFKRQLDYLEERYEIICVDQVVDCLAKGKKLPKNACWLTFDDGYKDHYLHAFPELKRRGLQGTFFPPSCAVENNEVLDVNILHHVLAVTTDIRALRSELDNMCIEAAIDRQALEGFWREHGVANRFDSAETIYIKRMLQHALPETLRRDLAKALFTKYVGFEPTDFASTLYMSKNEIRTLIREGMCVGSHGAKHYWLNRISTEDQRTDLKKSLMFLEDVGASTEDWIMCYPFGGYNSETLKILQDLGSRIGVTTEVRMADLSIDNPLTLPRFDTNDFPQ